MQLKHVRTLHCTNQQPRAKQPRLTGIAVDQKDRLLAVIGQEVKRFTPKGELEWRIPVPDVAWSITAVGESIWIGMRGKIGQFDARGQLQTTITEEKRLGRITALAVHEDILLAADATNRTIHLFHDGKWQNEIGTKVNTRGFMIPNGMLDLMLDDNTKTLLVAHPQKHRIERYTLEGELTDKFGRFGMEDPGDFGGCCNPTNIAVNQRGLIAVSEKAPPRVKLFSSQGEYITQSAAGIFDESTKNIDIATDSRGRLYATDPLRRTIEEFHLQATKN